MHMYMNIKISVLFINYFEIWITISHKKIQFPKRKYIFSKDIYLSIIFLILSTSKDVHVLYIKRWKVFVFFENTFYHFYFSSIKFVSYTIILFETFVNMYYK